MEHKLDYFMKLAGVAARQSKCLKRRIGAVIVDDEWHVRAIGYNGVPRGFPHCVKCLRDPDTHIDVLLPDCPAVHAEANALLQLEEKRHATMLFTTTFPCLNCAKLIANTNIKTIYYGDEYATAPENDERVREIFRVAGITSQRLTWNAHEGRYQA